MKNEIDHVIFDLGGVLLNIDLSLITSGFGEIMQENSLSRGKLQQEVIPAYETGKISTSDFLMRLTPFLKPGFTEVDIIRIWNSIILDMPTERLKMLGELRSHYRVHLLSNTNDLHACCFEANFRTWFNEDPKAYFDRLFYSHLIGRRKPDITTYEWVIGELDADPNRTIFIDDMPENIEGARNVGIRAHQLMNQKIDVVQLVEDLGLL